MFWLPFSSKSADKQDLINKDRKEYEKRRNRFLDQQEREKANAPRKSVRDRVSGVIHKAKVGVESRRLKRWKNDREKTHRKEENKRHVRSESEKAVFGEELSPAERQRYNQYRSEQREIKARRRAKLKGGLSKASSSFDGLSSAFDMSSAAQESPFDFNVADDKRQYGKRAGAIHDGLDQAFNLSPQRSSGRKSRDTLSEMFVIKSPPARGKRTQKGDPLRDMFSITPAKGRRRKRDPWSLF
jgi:hypothetical protein